jgi:hypothetical protein
MVSGYMLSLAIQVLVTVLKKNVVFKETNLCSRVPPRLPVLQWLPSPPLSWRFFQGVELPAEIPLQSAVSCQDHSFAIEVLWQGLIATIFKDFKRTWLNKFGNFSTPLG